MEKIRNFAMSITVCLVMFFIVLVFLAACALFPIAYLMFEIRRFFIKRAWRSGAPTYLARR